MKRTPILIAKILAIFFSLGACGQYSGNPGSSTEDDGGTKVVSTGGEEGNEARLVADENVDRDIVVTLGPGDNLITDETEESIGRTIMSEASPSIRMEIGEEFSDLYGYLTLELPLNENVLEGQPDHVKVVYRSHGVDDSESILVSETELEVADGVARVKIINGAGHYHVVLIENTTGN